MEELGHVHAATSEGTKRLFEITADGRAYLRENEAALNSALARMDMAVRAVSGEAPPAGSSPRDAYAEGGPDVSSRRLGRKRTERVRKIIEGAAEAIAGKSDREQCSRHQAGSS
jgi:hypothetical protein